MTGGNVVMSTVSDEVQIDGRVSSAGAKVAPSTGAGLFTPAQSSTGVYTVTPAQSYPQYLSCVVALEGATAGMWTATYASGVITIRTFNSSGSAADFAFSFKATFTENLAP